MNVVVAVAARRRSERPKAVCNGDWGWDCMMRMWFAFCVWIYIHMIRRADVVICAFSTSDWRFNIIENTDLLNYISVARGVLGMLKGVENGDLPVIPVYNPRTITRQRPACRLLSCR